MKQETKREIIFEIPDNSDYRVVCRIGYHDMINYAWWGYVQKKVYYKKWLLFGGVKYYWYEIDSCWWAKEIESVEDLKKRAMALYDENVLMIPRIIKKAIEIK